jgi:hypothetical protein
MTDPLDELTTALQPVVRAGLPLRPGVAPDSLLNLAGVIARSVNADDLLARVDALDRLLRAVLKSLTPPEPAEAAQLLFIVARGGKTLTTRRTAAAAALDYELHHFRKRIEPAMLRDIAWQLHRDSLQYVSRSRDGAPFEASGSMPIITEEQIVQPDTAEREILLWRIWSDVYGLRAELIARETTAADHEQHGAHSEAATGALWYLARLLAKLHTYTERYGTSILHGSADYNANALIRLAGWTGEVTTEQARELRFVLAQVGEWDREAFGNAITSSTSILH